MNCGDIFPSNERWLELKPRSISHFEPLHLFPSHEWMTVLSKNILSQHQNLTLPEPSTRTCNLSFLSIIIFHWPYTVFNLCHLRMHVIFEDIGWQPILSCRYGVLLLWIYNLLLILERKCINFKYTLCIIAHIDWPEFNYQPKRNEEFNSEVLNWRWV